MACPDDNTLVGFIHRTLPAASRTEVELHLRNCSACRAVVAGVAAQGSGLLEVPTVTSDGTPRAIVQAQLAPDERVGRYIIIKPVGAGGMGVVYAARDPDLARQVALKMLRWETLGATDASEGRARLMREAQTMARLSHPNVVAVHDVGSYGDQVFLAMEFVEGMTLTQWLRAGRSLAEKLEVFRQASLGLAAAHAAGLVHRDFKPSNVLVSSDWRVRVTDFGLARAFDESTPAPPVQAIAAAVLAEGHVFTRTGAVMGTPGYMPPEQIVGGRADARADQFSFCVTLYEALYGVRPFKGKTLLELYGEMSAAHFVAPPPGSRVPLALHRALLRGLRMDPGDRHPSMEALFVAMQPRRRSRLVWAGAVAGVMLLAGGGAWVVQRREPVVVPPPVAVVAPQPAAAYPSVVIAAAPPPVEAPPGPLMPAPPKVPRAKRPPPRANQGDGLLSVHVAPWGEVSIDDRTAQSANYMDYVVPLSAGHHQLVVTHPRFGRKTETVVIEAGRTLQRTVVMQ